jgi:hypothetical protein
MTFDISLAGYKMGSQFNSWMMFNMIAVKYREYKYCWISEVAKEREIAL